MMTGEKDRFKTHEQLWKLEDGELSTPKHDELVLQLLYKKNVEKFIQFLYPYYKDTNLENNIAITCEKPITSNNNNFIIGYLDFFIACRIDNRTEMNFIVEVKPKIRSFGETLRQLKTYRQYLLYGYPNADYIVYTPDTTFKLAFETQGVKLVTPSDLGLK